METLNFIFRLGVVFAIFGFLWFLVHLGISLLRGSRNKSVTEAYILKFIRYFFLVDVTVLFAFDVNDGFLAIDKAVMAGLILLVYFLGKLQNAQLRTNMFRVQGVGGANFLNQFKPVFHYKSELVVIILSVAIFTFLLIYPNYAANTISSWFYESIIDIEDTPVFGFIFKVIGFFFVLSIFMKLANAFATILSGGSLGNKQNHDKQEDDFDDYIEIK